MRQRTILILSILILAAAAGSAQASEFRAQPAITVSEEYNDNVFLHPRDKQTDYITRVIPSLSILYSAPLWDWEIEYNYEFRYYALGTIRDDSTQRLDLVSRTRVIPEFFFIDIKDTYSSVSLFTSQDYTRLSANVNQTQANFLTVTPYFVFRPTERMVLKTGYQYRNNWYQDPAAVDKEVHSGFLDLTQEFTARLKLTAAVWYSSTKSEPMNFTQSYFLVGPRYEYQDGSILWLQVGANKFSGYPYDWNTRPLWDAGFLQQLPPISIRYETNRTWIDDPLIVIRRRDEYMVTLSRKVERTDLSSFVAYREYGLAGYSDERVYSIGATFSHFLTEKLQALYALTIDRVEAFPPDAPDTMSIVYLTQVRFNYHAQEDLTYAADFRYADGYSPDIYINNYENIRVILEVKKSF